VTRKCDFAMLSVCFNHLHDRTSNLDRSWRHQFVLLILGQSISVLEIFFSRFYAVLKKSMQSFSSLGEAAVQILPETRISQGTFWDLQGLELFLTPL